MLRILSKVSIASFLMFAIVPFSGLVGCDKKKEIAPKKSIRPIKYYMVEPQMSVKKMLFTGTAVAGKESALSFKVSGTVDEVLVSIGDSVKKGALLARLDKTDLDVDLDGARASLKSAEADEQAAITQLNTTSSHYERTEKLYESSNVSLSEFEQALGEFETAKAQLKAAKSQVTTAQTKVQAAQNQLDYTELTAPYPGVVNTIAIEENEEITPGSTALTLSGFSNLEVKINISDVYIAKISKGLECNILFSVFPNKPVKGLVSEIPYAVSDAPTYPVTIQLQKENRAIRPGMSAEVQFATSSSDEPPNLYLLPDSVGEDAGGNFVFLLQPTHDDIAVAKKTNVALGELTDKGFIVRNGVKHGDTIASSGLQILMDNMEVKLMPDPVKNW